MREMNDLVMRLRQADQNSMQRTAGSRIFGEAADEIERLRAARLDRDAAIMIARIINDEIGEEICTSELAEAASERIVCALNNHEQDAPK